MRIFVTVAACCFLLAISGCDWFEKKPVGLNAEERLKLAKELVHVSREEGKPGLHAWLKARDPKTAEQALTALDDNLDRSGRTRVDVLDAIAALGADGLPQATVHEWAESLRRLASQMLHAGPEREALVAKSYQMEGQDAAVR